MSANAPGDRFTPATREVIEQAKASVLKYKHTHITPEHMLLALVQTNDTLLAKGFQIAKATPAQIKILVEHHLRVGDMQLSDEQLAFSERAKRVIEAARDESARAHKEQIGPEHLLLGLARVRNTVAGAVLAAVDLKEDELRTAVVS
jgi:ATP-dependent Clp protease ATP-binding subunit ClpC